MANTLTGLLPIMYNALNVVSREQIGFIPAVNRDATADMVAENQVVRSPVVPTMTGATITPTNIAATGDDRNISYTEVSINNFRKVSFNLTGEQELGLGPNNAKILSDTFAEAFRTLSNEMEEDLAQLYVGASRAYGTAGTTPFGTADDLSDASQVMKILDDNGAPKAGRSLILGTAAVANLLGKQPSMFKVNEAGGSISRALGALTPLYGFNFGVSGKVQTHTVGTAFGASPDYLTDTPSAYDIGDTTIHLDTGAGTHVAGDVITFAGDSNKYIIGTGSASSGDKDIVLNGPGLRTGLIDGVVAEVGAAYEANLAFSRDAFLLATRVPAVPSGGDQAEDRTYVTDPVSGITFEVAIYRQYRQVTMEVGVAWGVKAVKPAHAAILLG